jgi:hypothetical protein
LEDALALDRRRLGDFIGDDVVGSFGLLAFAAPAEKGYAANLLEWDGLG